MIGRKIEEIDERGFGRKTLKPFWLSNWVSIAIVAALLLKAGRGQQWLQQTWKRPVSARARPIRQCCAGARPKELVYWFCCLALAVKTFDCLLEQAEGVIARWPAGARTWTQT